jgi:hypothetical protein
MYRPLGSRGGRKQNLRDFWGTLDMAVVACVHFADVPSAGVSFFGKGLEKRTGRVLFRNTAYECCRNSGPMVLAKRELFLKAPQTEITQSLAHKIPGLSGFESPEV